MTHAYEKVREENYFEDVLRNTRSASGGWTVRFGETGDGVGPNYQMRKPCLRSYTVSWTNSQGVS